MLLIDLPHEHTFDHADLGAREPHTRSSPHRVEHVGDQLPVKARHLVERPGALAQGGIAESPDAQNCQSSPQLTAVVSAEPSPPGRVVINGCCVAFIHDSA